VSRIERRWRVSPGAADKDSVEAGGPASRRRRRSHTADDRPDSAGFRRRSEPDSVLSCFGGGQDGTRIADPGGRRDDVGAAALGQGSFPTAQRMLAIANALNGMSRLIPSPGLADSLGGFPGVR